MALLAMDERVGRRLYSAAQSNDVLRTLATLLSLSGDELLWFGLTGAFISASFLAALARGLLAGSAARAAGCAEQCLSDCFGTMCVASVLEICGKCLFRRARPAYAPQAAEHSLPAEHFSLPSGHSLRAGVIVFWLRHNPHAELVRDALGLPRPSLASMALWACAVAIARVLKGKHFPIDCIAGLGVGLAAGSLMEQPIAATGAMTRGWLKVVCGTFVTACWGPMMLLPLCRKIWPTLGVGPFSVAYYCFYGYMLVSRMPRQAEEADWWPGSCG
ncbi:hypothetical protein AB1Y20_015006 [Prymnesium parvum]|uniref:Phosphatidic acid phosphatase type 2/haloperoxidase domain-containing protein n=1 Tax=Prymnesium parvum TaxID=97485 RepID=A0AB34JZ40_PRYPA